MILVITEEMYTCINKHHSKMLPHVQLHFVLQLPTILLQFRLTAQVLGQQLVK